MKLAIKTIESIKATNARSWNHLGKNGSIPIDSYVTGPWAKLEFTSLTANLEEDWQESPSGLFSQINVTGIIRGLQTKKCALTELAVTKNIYRITSIAGEKMIVGSIEFAPKFTFKKVLAGITTYESQFTIICKSPQGLIYDTSI